jgi:hypothetical protein
MYKLYNLLCYVYIIVFLFCFLFFVLSAHLKGDVSCVFKLPLKFQVNICPSIGKCTCICKCPKCPELLRSNLKGNSVCKRSGVCELKGYLMHKFHF